MTDEIVPGRRLFLRSLVGATVGYCFLQSVPLIREGCSQVFVAHLNIAPNMYTVDTRSFAALLVKVYSRDRLFAPFGRELSPLYDGPFRRAVID